MQERIREIITKLIKAIETENYEYVRQIFADDIENYITNSTGSVYLLKGSENYINALKKMNFNKVKPSLTITQIDVINNHEAMFMLEVKAQKPNKSLHNFAAYLVKFAGEKIVTMRMVEALPEYSDKFWND